ncbi:MULTISPECIES: metallophosphoesterase [Oceanospirillaceae]|jgi:hypothetical protein|uniref:Metallophosphoesterase n=1 Tax=Oceanobacter antarcticus TaxID=3133425 RepID=A0ABW8NDZ4_9GAMM
MHQGYDLIGDIHGCGQTLVTLLEQMGYRKQHGVYRHNNRKAVFVGDVVDRGPHIRLACEIVKNMVDAGEAEMLMGNHEYNLITYCTKAPAGMRQPFLREHTRRNTRIVEATMEQFANYPQELNEMLDWFLERPLFAEYDHFRVVHACWDSDMIAEYIARYGGNQLDRDLLVESVDTSSFLHQFLDRMLRGTSLKLPQGRSMTAKDGFVRQFFRTKFWEHEPSRYSDVLFQPDPLPDDLQHSLLSDAEKRQLLFYSAEEKPLFFGHYWMAGIPSPLSSNLACIDYSAVKYGRLVAYRMDTEHQLQPSKFTWVRVEKNER